MVSVLVETTGEHIFIYPQYEYDMVCRVTGIIRPYGILRMEGLELQVFGNEPVMAL